MSRYLFVIVLLPLSATPSVLSMWACLVTRQEHISSALSFGARAGDMA
jgi:hypothetical protein